MSERMDPRSGPRPDHTYAKPGSEQAMPQSLIATESFHTGPIPNTDLAINSTGTGGQVGDVQISQQASVLSKFIVTSADPWLCAARPSLDTSTASLHNSLETAAESVPSFPDRSSEASGTEVLPENINQLIDHWTQTYWNRPGLKSSGTDDQQEIINLLFHLLIDQNRSALKAIKVDETLKIIQILLDVLEKRNRPGLKRNEKWHQKNAPSSMEEYWRNPSDKNKKLKKPERRILLNFLVEELSPNSQMEARVDPRHVQSAEEPPASSSATVPALPPCLESPVPAGVTVRSYQAQVTRDLFRPIAGVIDLQGVQAPLSAEEVPLALEAAPLLPYGEGEGRSDDDYISPIEPMEDGSDDDIGGIEPMEIFSNDISVEDLISTYITQAGFSME